MHFSKEQAKIVRECEIEWHCHEIVLSQPSTTDGYNINGYGAVKSNENGGLYLDFICLASNKHLSASCDIPKDELDESQQLAMSATAIDGTLIWAVGLQLRTTLQQMLSGLPRRYRIGLNQIQIGDSSDVEERDSSYLYLEFNEKGSIPLNTANTVNSSLGGESSSWNEARIVFGDIDVRIIQHDDHTEVSASGRFDSIEKLRDSIVFYISYTSGILVQPYFEHLLTPAGSTRKIHGIDRTKIRSRINPPVPGNFKTGRGEPSDPHHDLLERIYRVFLTNPSYFETIHAQWGRIWHSFFSNDISVPMLVVSVAVEGVVNDVFLPSIASDLRDEAFEEQKKALKAKISCITDASESHLVTLLSFVDRWGSPHAKKALGLLVERKAIEQAQVKCWEKLRNSSAHPKLLTQDERRMRKNVERTVVCLGLFYRLTLNVFSYRGAQYTYRNAQDNKHEVLEHVAVLR